MTVLEIPDIRFDATRFETLHTVKSNRLASGSTERQKLAPALWSASFRTKTLSFTEASLMDVFFERLGGGVALFRGRDTRRCRPFNHASGFGGLTVGGQPFTGAATIEEFDINAGAVTINDVPNGLSLAPGDLFDLTKTIVGGRDITRLLRCAAPAAAALGRIVVEVSIPANLAPFEVGDAVNFDDPGIAMIVQGSPTESRNQQMRSWSWNAVEAL